MFKKIMVSILFLLCTTLLIFNVQAMEQNAHKKLVILHDGTNFTREARHALINFIATIDNSLEIVAADVLGSDQELSECLNGCSAVIYCQRPNHLITQSLLALIVRNNESLADAHGVSLYGLPTEELDDREVAQRVSPDIDRMIRFFNMTARRLQRLLSNIPAERKAFLNLWLRNDAHGMGEVLRGGHSVELCPITTVMGNRALDLWYRTQEPYQENSRIHFASGYRDIEPQITGAIHFDEQPEGCDALCTEFAQWLRAACQIQPRAQQPANVQQPVNNQQPAGDMITLPHLVPAEQPAVDHPGIISRCVNKLRQIFWPRIDLPTLDRNRQIHRADLHDSLITEVDAHMAARENFLSALAKRSRSCGALGALAMLSRALIKHWAYKKAIPATLAAGLFSFLGYAFFSACCASIFQNHRDAINGVRLVDPAQAARLKGFFAGHYAGRESKIRYIIDEMTARGS